MASWWADQVERELRKRPSGHAEPTDQDLYWDSGQTSDGADAEDVPWLDQDAHRERELGT